MNDGDDEPVTTARTLPMMSVEVLVRHYAGNEHTSSRVYVERQDLALWLSLVIDAAHEDEQWIVREIRRLLLAGSPA